MKGMKNPDNPILIVDDDSGMLRCLELFLASANIDNIISCQDSRDVEQILASHDIELVLLDLVMPHITGKELLDLISRDYPQIPVIIFTGTDDVSTAVDCMKKAFDYILKPVVPDRFQASVSKALEIRNLKRENEKLKEVFLSDKLQDPDAFKDIITKDKKMNSIFKYVEAISLSKQPVIINGESGTGKELIAKAIHSSSDRSGEFVAVNVAGLDEQMFSDILFGHMSGAYTGANGSRQGLVEKASRGTLFLDEIGDLNLNSQVKLLRLIQEQEYYPIGSDIPKKADVRIVVATHQNLEQLQKNGSFRRDLYYRLITHLIELPPLRSRLGDIEPLVHYFLNHASTEMSKELPVYPPELITLLKSYDYPGNLRELQAMVYDAVAHHQSGVMSLNSFRSRIRRDISFFTINYEKEQLGESPCKDCSKTCLTTIENATSMLIEKAMERAEGNQTIAAEILGISQPALSKRLKRINNNQKKGSYNAMCH